MTNTAKEKNIVEGAELTDSTRKIQEVPPFTTVDHLLAEYNQKDEQIAEAFPHYKNKLAAVMCAASKKLSHDDADSAKALLGLIDSGDSKVIKQLAKRLHANLADTSHNNWETMYLSIATFAHHVPSELLGHDDVYPLLAALSARLKGVLTSEPTLLLPAIYAVHLLILKLLAAGITHITEEKRTTIQSQLSAVRETVSELVKMTKEGEPPLSHYHTAMLTTIKTLLSSSEQLLDEGILKIESKRTKRIKRMKQSGRFVFQLARCATSWYGTVQSAGLSAASSIASTWQCLNTGRQLMSPLVAQTKTYLIGPSEAARLIASLHEWHQAESSVTRLDLLESDRTQASEDYGYVYGMVALLRWIDDENDEAALSSAIQKRMVAYFDAINDKTMPEQQQLYDAILDWIVSKVKDKPPGEWPTVFMRGTIPKAIQDYQPSDNATAPSQPLDCFATAWYQQFPHDKAIQDASHRETVSPERWTLLKKDIDQSPEKQSPWGAYCFAQLCARYDVDNPQGGDVVATDEAIVALQQTLKNIGCTDYKNIPEEQLVRLLTLDDVERKQILQMMSQFVRKKIAASGQSTVSVVQYLEGVLNRTVHDTAVPKESMSHSSSERTVESQQATQISLTANSQYLNDGELLSQLPVTLSLPPIEASHHARVNIKVSIKDSFNVSTRGTSFVLPELSVLTTHLVSLRETHLSQDDVNILLDIAKTCQQHDYVVHAVCLYALLYRAKEQNAHHDTHTRLFYETQLTPLLNQPPCASKQIAFQSAQGTFHQPVAIQASDTWFDVGLHFQQSALLHYLLCHGGLPQAFNSASTEKETGDGRVVVTDETMLHRLCRSGITDVSLYQRCIKMWPQALGARTVEGHLPVHHAACFANQDVFDYVAKKTTKTTTTIQADSQGNRLLHLAAMSANTEVVNVLLRQADIEVNARNADNGTPLHCAALGRQLAQGRALSDYAAVFNSLLVQGADPMAVDNHQNTARDIIRLSGNVRLLAVFDKVLNCTAPERLWQYWQTAMMSYYCKETFVNKRLFNDDYFSLVNYFVNLQVVKKQDDTTQEQQPSDDKPSYQPLRERDRLVGEKETVELSDLFQPSTYQEKERETLSSINTVVLSGAAGVGKTTLMDYLAYQWALFKKGEGETGLWSTFETVLMVRCRDLYPEALKLEVKEKSLANLLRCACWGQLDISLEASRQLLAILKKKPDKSLLLFDGLDELPEPKQAYWHDLLVQLFQLPFKKLVTTRPYAVGKLPQWISHEGLVEISGFTDSNVAVYFEKVLGQSNETEEFIQSVKKNPDLWAITHIPIHAYLLKSWWVTTGSQAGGAPLATLSISDLYRSLIVDVCRRYLAKISELNDSELISDDVVLNDPRVHRLLDTLGRWAFEGLRQNSAQLPMSWLNGIQDSDEKPTLLSTSQCEQLEVGYLKKVGLLKEVGSHIGAQQRFEFLHLSFQEFLAANVIAVTLRQGEKAEKTHLTQVIHWYKYDLNFTLVWPSVAGLLRRYPTALNNFLLILITGPKDWVGFVEADLLMRCLEASLPSRTDTKVLGLQQQALLRAVKQRIKWFNKLPQAWQKATVKILSMCPRLICLNADAVWAFLWDEEVDSVVRAKLASSAVAYCSPTPEWEAAVCAFLWDEQVDENVRDELAICAVAHWLPTPALVEAVLAFLRDEKVAAVVRVKLASSAVAHWLPTPEWVEAVLALLRDEQVDGDVRAELVIGAVAHWSPTPEWVAAALAFLQDKKVNGGARGELARSIVAHWSPTPALMEAVLAFLRDEKLPIFTRGQLTRGAVAHWLPTPEWVAAVCAFFRDEKVVSVVRAELASSAVVHWLPTPALMEAVCAFLQDEQVDGDVRGELAISAVAHWRPTPEWVEAVCAFLRDEQVDSVVRGELARSIVVHWLPTPALMEAVCVFLRDEQVGGYVREALAISAVAHWRPTPEWVEAVCAFLRDEQVDSGVRGELASSAVAYWSPTPALMAAVWVFLRDEQVDGYVRVELAIDAVAHWSSTPELEEVVLAFLRDEQVDGYVRGELARSAAAYWSSTPEWEAAVLAFLRDEQVDRYVRVELAIGVIAHWPPTPESETAVWAFLRDEKLPIFTRGQLARSAVAYWSSTPEWEAAVWAFLRDEQEHGYVRVELAIGAVAHGSSTPEWEEVVLALLRNEQVARGARVELADGVVAHWPLTLEWVAAVWVLLRDEQVDRDVCGKLAIGAVAHWSPTPELEEAVLALLRDEQMGSRVRSKLLRRTGAHWLSTSEWVEAVLALLRDEQVDVDVRCELASGAGAHWSPTPEWMKAVLGFLRDKKANKYVRYELMRSVIQQWSKWPNKVQAFLGILFVKNSYRRYLSWCADIPVHLLLPLYKKTHNKGRQYIREQLVKHRVVVYKQAGTVLVRQAGKTECLELSQSTIQQIKQDFKSYRLTFDVPVSALFRQRFFATSRTTNTSSSQRTKGKQTRREECTIT